MILAPEWVTGEEETETHCRLRLRTGETSGVSNAELAGLAGDPLEGPCKLGGGGAGVVGGANPASGGKSWFVATGGGEGSPSAGPAGW
eukprot:746226-Hanusia_phi.AAC.1